MNPSPSSPTGMEYNPRKRGRTACTRCKSRKQRCDNDYPNCSNCRKAGVQCDKSSLNIEGDNSSGYTRALEERIAFLEGRLSQQLSEPKAADDTDATRIIHPISAASQRQTPDTVQTGMSNSGTLGEIVGFLSVDSADTPAYVGSSSGLSLAVNLGELVRATIVTKSFPDSPGSMSSSHRKSSRDDTTNKTNTAHTPYKTIDLNELLKHRANPPNDEMGSRIVDAYVTRVHYRYPFLDREELWKLHGARWRLAETKTEDLTQAERFGIFKLYMVYAIASTLISLSEKYEYTAPEKFYMTAIQYVAAACETRSVQNIQAMLLLVIYHLRSATSHGLWYMIGLAMRTCIDLGLHRKGSSTARLDPYTVQLRRRLFWVVYYLERAISLSLGRPFSINDRQIDIDLPLDVDDDVRDPAILTSAQSKPPQEPASKPTNLSLFRALIRIRQIDSRIQHTIYRADRPLQELRPKLDKIYRILEEWKTSLLLRLHTDMDYATLHYNRSLRLLVQPFLPLLPITDPYYHICVRAAGDICQLHKKLHQTLEYGHSFLGVQTVFVSGITMLYALWANTDKVWSVRMSNDIRACSTVLFVMTERAAWVKRYRDTFELLVNAAMEKLQGNEAAKISGMAGMMAAQSYGSNFNTVPNYANIYPAGVKRTYMTPTTATIPMTTTTAEPSVTESALNFPDIPMLSSAPTQQEQQQQELQPQQQLPQNQFQFDVSEDVMRMAMELAPWIDQDLGGEGGTTTTPLWMPDFDTLQNLTSPYQY